MLQRYLMCWGVESNLKFPSSLDLVCEIFTINSLKQKEMFSSGHNFVGRTVHFNMRRLRFHPQIRHLFSLKDGF